jgi:hypothetical protein
MGGVQGREALDEWADRGQRCLGIILRRAGQRGF